MKTFLCLLALLLPLAAEDVALVPQPSRLSVLKNVEVRRSGPFAVVVTWPEAGVGCTTYPAWELTVAQQRKCGFDPVVVATEMRRVLAARAATEAANRRAAEAPEVREEFIRCKTALLNWSLDQSARRDRTYDPAKPNVTAQDIPVLRQLFSEGGRLDDLLARYGVPH